MSFSNALGRVQVGPGTLYVAALGTAEPTSVSGAWPAGWQTVGYTTGGSTFTYQNTFAPVYVEEELIQLSNIATASTATLAFSMAELTARNLQLALNGGLAANSDAQGTTAAADGTIWVTPTTLGAEVRLMLGWDTAPKGTTPTATTAIERLIVRQAIQTGSFAPARVKGATEAAYAVTFSAEVPGIAGTTGNGAATKPFVILKQASLAA